MQALPNIKFRLRVNYKKVGLLSFLSHLEVVRCLEMIVRRSGLPYCVSQGYSPHMKISFGTALGVGIESEKQIFDIYLTEYVKDEVALAALKKASEGSLEVISCEYVDNNAAAASAIFGKTNYEVIVDSIVENIIVPEQIIISKKGRDKIIETKDYLVGSIDSKICDKTTIINFCLESKSSGSCKPEAFIKQVLKNSGCCNAQIINFKII